MQGSEESTGARRAGRPSSLCKHWIRGCCKQGARCRFRHDDPVSAPTSEGQDDSGQMPASVGTEAAASSGHAVDAIDEGETFRSGPPPAAMGDADRFTLLKNAVQAVACAKIWADSSAMRPNAGPQPMQAQAQAQAQAALAAFAALLQAAAPEEYED
mmetsp:Transcript_95946/g.268573  ORF Transcript_95946/g.268573 Transcript_95946/m.268573 type:complete len:157 (+) Transcript_95946:83-553(+)